MNKGNYLPDIIQDLPPTMVIHENYGSCTNNVFNITNNTHNVSDSAFSYPQQQISPIEPDQNPEDFENNDEEDKQSESLPAAEERLLPDNITSINAAIKLYVGGLDVSKKVKLGITQFFKNIFSALPQKMPPLKMKLALLSMTYVPSKNVIRNYRGHVMYFYRF
jgi:hypothetical protein